MRENRAFVFSQYENDSKVVNISNTCSKNERISGRQKYRTLKIYTVDKFVV